MTDRDALISLVIPVYSEEAVIPALLERMTLLMEQLPERAEVVLVNDGSRDNSLQLMTRLTSGDERFRVVNLSRNYGHQTAVTAGLNAARGDAVITMDADLQDPPEVVPQLVQKWREGNHIVLARREARAGESIFKRATAAAFYRIIRRLSSIDMPLDVGDFRLLDRKVVDALSNMPEQDRYLRGMISWVGFQTAEVPFVREERAAGESKYPLRAMIKLAVNGLLGFSDVPLRLALWFGMIISMLALLFGVYILISWFFGGEVVEGWTSTVLIVTMLGGLQLLMIGVVGLYIGRIHNEVKRRPLYFVDPDTAARAAEGQPQGAPGHHPVNKLSGGDDVGGGGASHTSRAFPSSE
ncbi:glycosyltransferase family 2 protein [Aurantiacibacter rhizosphaerae]|uniref:Glycosyltransferase n=1 Tax=Aurantiacibacter rhizosphaerae TaxID=2691582 RepID=A0A844XA35_9SPHN|nr:glycosyltransferase family 2 protein [Aurantiacibacter rhizosphaerae]MWV26690.1 glycosyltransferase [Aurantiacibacter rhizosphaerae]